MNDFNESKVLWTQNLPGGWNWSHNMKVGTTLRITDIEGGANVSCLMFNARNYTERYNMADTLKAQFISHLTKGNVCYSDMGRVLLSIIDDTCGKHDPIGGVLGPEEAEKQYGTKPYQDNRNGYIRNGRDSLLKELAKYGMGLRDFHTVINFFSAVNVNADGAMSFASNNSKTGAYIDLQAEMETLVIVNTCPHPMDPSKIYTPKPVELKIWKSNISPEKNICRTFCEQNERGFINTRNYLL